MRKMIVAACAMLAAGMATQAGAATITFEGQTNTIYTAPITRSGFSLGNPTGQEQHFHELDTAGQGGIPSNGTGVLFNDRDTQIFLRQVGLGAFSLGSFDIASTAASNSGGLTFTVTGFLGGVQVGQVTGTLSQTALVTYAGFANVDYVLFDAAGVAGGQGGGFELDNLVVNAPVSGGVPEPTTWALMIVGFGGIAATMRRRATRRALA